MRTRYQYGRLDRRKRKKGPDVWQWRWYDQNGGRKSVLVGTVDHLPDKAAAERAIEALRIKINSHLPQARFQSVTINALLDSYFNEVADSMRKQTRSPYRSYAKHIRSQWGEVKVSTLEDPFEMCALGDPFAVAAWLKTLPKGTAPHVRSFFHLLFQFAKRKKLVKDNPISLVKQSRKRSKTPRVLTVEEFQALLSALNEPYTTRVQVCCALGLRASEMVALQWCDFDWQAQTVFVERSFVGEINPTKTAASEGNLPLGPELIEALLLLRSRTPYKAETDYVFANDNGKPRWQGVLLTDHIKPAAVRAGIGKIGWHTLRHTYSTLLHDLGAPLAVQKELLRHADIQTTMNIYTRAVSRTKRSSAEKVQSILMEKRA
jgi:integrase